MQSKTIPAPHGHSPRSHRVQRELAAARLALRRRCSDHALDAALDRLIEDACRPTPRPSIIRQVLRRVPLIRVLARSSGEREAAGV